VWRSSITEREITVLKIYFYLLVQMLNYLQTIFKFRFWIGSVWCISVYNCEFLALGLNFKVSGKLNVNLYCVVFDVLWYIVNQWF